MNSLGNISSAILTKRRDLLHFFYCLTDRYSMTSNGKNRFGTRFANSNSEGNSLFYKELGAVVGGAMLAGTCGVGELALPHLLQLQDLLQGLRDLGPGHARLLPRPALHGQTTPHTVFKQEVETHTHTHTRL